MMGEHDDELDAAPAGRASDDAARIADAIALGTERLARAIEQGLREVAEALRGGSRKTRSAKRK